MFKHPLEDKTRPEPKTPCVGVSLCHNTHLGRRNHFIRPSLAEATRCHPPPGAVSTAGDGVEVPLNRQGSKKTHVFLHTAHHGPFCCGHLRRASSNRPNGQTLRRAQQLKGKSSECSDWCTKEEEPKVIHQIQLLSFCIGRSRMLTVHDVAGPCNQKGHEEDLWYPWI